MMFPNNLAQAFRSKVRVCPPGRELRSLELRATNTAHHNERIAGILFCLLCEPESNEMAQNGFVKPSACDVKEGVASDLHHLETGGGTLNAESA